MAMATSEEIIERFGQTALDALTAAPHEQPTGDASDVQAVFDQALETAEEELFAPLMGTYESQIPGWSEDRTTAPMRLRKLCQELVMIILRERGDLSQAYENPRWKQIVGYDTPSGHVDGILDRYGKLELKFEGVSFPDVGLAKSSVNDGRVPLMKRSHYDDDGERIEGDDERTPGDVW